MYSRKFSQGGDDRPGAGIIPPDYGGVAYRSDALRQSVDRSDDQTDEDRDTRNPRRPRRALYRESDPPSDPPSGYPPIVPTEWHRETRPGIDPGERDTREEEVRPRHRKLDPSPSSSPPPPRPFQEECAEEAREAPSGERDDRGEERDDASPKKGGLFPGLSRLTKHSFTMEDILLAGIILLLLNGEGDVDNDLLLLLGFLLLTGMS